MLDLLRDHESKNVCDAGCVHGGSLIEERSESFLSAAISNLLRLIGFANNSQANPTNMKLRRDADTPQVRLQIYTRFMFQLEKNVMISTIIRIQKKQYNAPLSSSTNCDN